MRKIEIQFPLDLVHCIIMEIVQDDAHISIARKIIGQMILFCASVYGYSFEIIGVETEVRGLRKMYQLINSYLRELMNRVYLGVDGAADVTDLRHPECIVN